MIYRITQLCRQFYDPRYTSAKRERETERQRKSTVRINYSSTGINDKPGSGLYFIFILFAFRGNAVPTGWEYHVSSRCLTLTACCLLNPSIPFSPFSPSFFFLHPPPPHPFRKTFRKLFLFCPRQLFPYMAALGYRYVCLSAVIQRCAHEWLPDCCCLLCLLACSWEVVWVRWFQPATRDGWLRGGDAYV